MNRRLQGRAEYNFKESDALAKLRGMDLSKNREVTGDRSDISGEGDRSAESKTPHIEEEA